MKLYRYAIAVAGATFILLIVGGIVNPTGSALACPDWPLCYGQFFPKMTGGILFEHTHRLVAAAVGLMTVFLAGWIWREKKDKQLRTLGLVAVGLVTAQGVLGGITVLLKLPLLASSGHLALSMFFFGFIIYLASLLRPREPAPRGAKLRYLLGRSSAAAALVSVYVQIVFGSIVRHTGSGRACGTDWLLCQGQLFPYWGPGILNMIHRFIGLVVFGIVIAASVIAYREAVRTSRSRTAILALAAPIMTFAQIVLGVATVATSINVPIVTAHLGVGALILADWLVIYLSLRLPVATMERRLELVAG